VAIEDRVLHPDDVPHASQVDKRLERSVAFVMDEVAAGATASTRLAMRNGHVQAAIAGQGPTREANTAIRDEFVRLARAVKADAVIEASDAYMGRPNVVDVMPGDDPGATEAVVGVSNVSMGAEGYATRHVMVPYRRGDDGGIEWGEADWTADVTSHTLTQSLLRGPTGYLADIVIKLGRLGCMVSLAPELMTSKVRRALKQSGGHLEFVELNADES
jgi:hypothetical protein